MLPNSGQIFGLIQGDLAALVVFLAAISVTSWVIVATTVIMRFGALVRYKRRLVQLSREEEGADQQ